MKIRILVLLLVSISTSAQNLLQGELLWKEDIKLASSDYLIKISSQKNTPIFSQFVIRTNTISGFDFFKRNFNQKVENIFLGNASWIEDNEEHNIKQLIAYQQVQFDLSEVMTRKFRKQILEHKKEISKKPSTLNIISQEIMTDFSNQRLLLEKETESGSKLDIIIQWSDRIKEQLLNLNEFRFENQEKIILKK